MSGLTPRFGLSYFGGGLDGSISDDGQKFTLGDRLLIDRLFAAIESHDYAVRPTAETVEPTTPPTLTVSGDQGGTLPAGRTYYYSVSFLDARGLETRAGQEVSASTPPALPVPLTPNGEAALGGALQPGLYYYGITALRDGEESQLSSPVTVTLLSGDGTAQLGLPPLGAAERYQVWRMAATESGYSRIGTTTTDAFDDDGSVPPNPCPTDPANQPPQFNTGMARYSVQVDLSPEDAALVGAGKVARWRLYRSTQSSNYGSESLVHEVIERTDELDTEAPLLTSWTDTGDALATGQPSTTSQSINLRPFTFPTADTLPDTAGYPPFYPLLVQGKLYALIAGTWTLVGGGGGAEPSGNGDQTAVRLKSPDGNEWSVAVENDGTLVTSILTVPPPAPALFQDNFARPDESPLGAPYVGSGHDLVGGYAVQQGTGERASVIDHGIAAVNNMSADFEPGPNAGGTLTLVLSSDATVSSAILFKVYPESWELSRLQNGGQTTLADGPLGHQETPVQIAGDFDPDAGVIGFRVGYEVVLSGVTYSQLIGRTGTHHGFRTDRDGAKVSYYVQFTSLATPA